MSLASPTARNAGLPLDSADAWVIAPDVHLGVSGRLLEVWRYRRILGFFAVKAIQSLYRDTRLGALWLVLRPLGPVLVGTAVFGGLMNAPSLGLPYFLFFLTGSIGWSFFAEPVFRGSRALEINRQLLRKLYLPRLILPAGQLAAGLVEPAVLLGVFAAAIGYYRVVDGVWYVTASGGLAAAGAAILAAVAFAFGTTLWTSVWQASARDMRYIVGYVLGFWFLLTPVVYPVTMIPAGVRWIASINPITAPVETVRWGLLGIGAPRTADWLVTSVAILATIAAGLWYFSRTESHTIDKL